MVLIKLLNCINLYSYYCLSANEYVLEKLSEPGVPINLEKSLESMGTREFCLVRFGRKYLI